MATKLNEGGSLGKLHLPCKNIISMLWYFSGQISLCADVRSIACWYLPLLKELLLHIGLLLLQQVFPNRLLQMVPWAAAGSFSPTVSCLANTQCKLCCLLPALINSRLFLIFMLWVVWSEVLLLLQYLRLCFTKLEPLLIRAFHARPKKKKKKSKSHS